MEDLIIENNPIISSRWTALFPMKKRATWTYLKKQTEKVKSPDLSLATPATDPSLNHLFIAGKGKPNPDEYQVSGNVDEAVIGDITYWIRKFN